MAGLHSRQAPDPIRTAGAPHPGLAGEVAPALVIFDCDGVLVDSEVLAAESLVEAFAAIGRVITMDHVYSRFLGRAFSTIEADHRAATGVDLPADFKDRQWATLERLFEARLRAIPGIEALVALLERRHIPFCIASSSTPERIRRSLELVGLRDRFGERIFSATQVRNGKPAPDLFLLAAAAMGAEPAGSLVIEDSPSGILAAKAAGMVAWGFTGGSHHVHLDGDRTLRECGADWVAAAMSDIGLRIEAMAGQGTSGG